MNNAAIKEGVYRVKYEVNFDDNEAKIVERYMRRMDMDISKVARQAILEMIFNDDADLAAYERAMEEYKKNPSTYTHDEVWKALSKA